jgi:hypothetical protein
MTDIETTRTTSAAVGALGVVECDRAGDVARARLMPPAPSSTA